MIDITKDIAIKSLLSSAKEIAPDLSEDLLVQLFLIEKHHQFNRDEESRYKAVKNLIEQFIDGQIGQ
jgi:hypothetical protein